MPKFLGFQTMVILDTYDVMFHAVVVLGPRSKFDFLLKIILIILSLYLISKFTLPTNTVGVFKCHFSDTVIIGRPLKFIFKSF